MKTLFEFVKEKHKGQLRIDNEPYFNHVERVANFFKKDSYLYNLALCHDLLEDTDCTAKELGDFLLGIDKYSKHTKYVIDLIHDLGFLTKKYTSQSHPSMNRYVRSDLESQRLTNSSKEAITVKYADIIDNLSSIENLNIEFAKVYISEKDFVLKRCNHGDWELYKKAIVTLEKAKEKIHY